MNVDVAPFDTEKPEPILPIHLSLVEVEKRHGVSPLKQIRDIFRLCFVRWALAPQEYYRLRLFALAADDPSLQDQFLGDRQGVKLNVAVSDLRLMTSLPIMRCKDLHWAIMKAAGLPVPEIQALCHPLRRLGAIPALTKPSDVADFLRNQARYPIFGKPVGALGSYGAASIERFDAATDSIVLLSGQHVSVDRFAREVIAVYGEEGYLFQSRIRQHPSVEDICGQSVGTVRVVTLRAGNRPEPLYSLWKVPASGSTADNFWREGNMLAALDPERGTVERVQRGTGLAAQEIERHPDTGADLMGFRVPHWDEVQEVAVHAACLTPDLRMMGWDIAICPEGPMIVEGNEVPDHTLYQFATGKGFMTPELVRIVDAIKADNKLALSRQRTSRKAEARTLQIKRRKALVDSIDLLGAQHAMAGDVKPEGPRKAPD